MENKNNIIQIKNSHIYNKLIIDQLKYFLCLYIKCLLFYIFTLPKNIYISCIFINYFLKI